MATENIERERGSEMKREKGRKIKRKREGE